MKKLKRNLNDLYLRTREFVKKISGEDRILLIHHKDLDGTISAVLLEKYLEKNGVKKSKVVCWANEDAENEIQKIKNFDKIIVVDIDISYLSKELNETKKEILIIDHHTPTKDLNNEKIVYMNPRLEDEKIYQPASYLVWKISGNDELKWQAIIGTIGDSGFEDCVDLLKGEVEAKKKDQIWKTRYAKVGFKVNAALTEIGFEKVREILLKTHTIEDLEKNDEINNCWEKYLKEYNKVKEKFWKNVKENGKIKLLISNVGEVQRPLTSAIATELGFKYKNKIIILLRDEEEKVAVNARYQGNDVHLGNLFRKISKGLDGGGGHEHAAGATIKKKDLVLFEKRLIKELEVIFKVKKAK